ncbi:hypothetical protein BGX34_011350 [Mortierella sp. NVP85]|nr:hypothetical protein BGX34_011350 [Mortierella sp. NVP85]
MAPPPAPIATPEFVYKLVSPASAFDHTLPVHPKSELDEKDGFYHLSTDAQVPATANRYFQKVDDLLILKIRYAGIESLVKWELAPGSDPADTSRIFPHVYGDLDQEHIIGTILVPRNDADNTWDFSEGWQNRLVDSNTKRGMVHHAYFAIEAGTVLLYLVCPADYGLRPVALLKRRLYYLLGTVGFWLAQPHLLPLDPSTSLLLDKRGELASRIGHSMKQREMERILKAGGQVDEEFLEQGFYAPQMAMAMKALGWMSIILAGLMAVEATFVAVKYSQLKAVEQSSVEEEKETQQATQASTSSGRTSTKATKRR